MFTDPMKALDFRFFPLRLCRFASSCHRHGFWHRWASRRIDVISRRFRNRRRQTTKRCAFMQFDKDCLTSRLRSAQFNPKSVSRFSDSLCLFSRLDDSCYFHSSLPIYLQSFLFVLNLSCNTSRHFSLAILRRNLHAIESATHCCVKKENFRDKLSLEGSCNGWCSFYVTRFTSRCLIRLHTQSLLRTEAVKKVRQKDFSFTLDYETLKQIYFTSSAFLNFFH